MTTDLILYNFTLISLLLLAFISILNPAKVNIVANRWFGLFLFAGACLLLNVILYEINAANKYGKLLIFNELSRFALAPALYLSVLHFTSVGKQINKTAYWHFTPFFLFFLYLFASVYLFPDKAPGVHYIQNSSLEKIFAIAMLYSVRVQLLVYWMGSWQKLSRHQKNIQQVTANTGFVKLTWLKFLLIAIAVMILAGFNGLFFKVKLITDGISFFYFACVLFICYFLLAQKEIYPFTNNELADISLLINNTEAKSNQRIPAVELTKLKQKLTHLMETEKPYLNNELSLPDLAKYMDMSSHDLSYLLNEAIGKNFFQFINCYRIKEARELLLSDKHTHLNMLGIAFAAGFNSKTTFNTAFKKETGFSPSQFLQQAKSGPANIASV